MKMITRLSLLALLALSNHLIWFVGSYETTTTTTTTQSPTTTSKPGTPVNRDQPRINLITPLIVSLRNDGCDQMNVTCNLTLWTRAARYKLLDFDIREGTTGTLVRDGQWVEPNRTIYHRDLGRTMSFEETAKMSREYKQNKEPDKKIMDETKDLYWLMCEAQLDIKSRRGSVACFKNKLSHWQGDGGITIQELMLPQLKNPLPISAMTTIDNTYVYGNNLTLFIDMSGRFVARSEPSLGRYKFSKVIDLSAIPQSSSENSVEWGKDPKRNLLDSQVELRRKLASQLDEKLSVSYLHAITPIALRVNSDKNNTQLSQLGFCFMRGYGGVLGADPLVCRFALEKENDMAPPKLDAPDDKRVSVLASSIAYHDGQMIFHLVYDIRPLTVAPEQVYENGTQQYLFCKRGEKADKTFAIPFMDTTKLEGCENWPIFLSPNDIVVFEFENKCTMTVAFYDQLYTTHKVDENIYTKSNVLKEIQFNFLMYAAFAFKNKLYAFTDSNSLFIYDVTSSDCNSIQLGSFKEEFAGDFMFKNVLGKSLPDTQLIDYREYEEGQDDTKPKSSQRDAPEPLSGLDMSTIIIIVCLVVFLTAIAILVYICCCMTPSEAATTRARPSKSPSNSEHLTVRSSSLSKISGSKQQPSKSKISHVGSSGSADKAKKSSPLRRSKVSSPSRSKMSSKISSNKSKLPKSSSPSKITKSAGKKSRASLIRSPKKLSNLPSKSPKSAVKNLTSGAK